MSQCNVLALVSILPFILCAFGDNRDLHSFPTRRSSDLDHRHLGHRSGRFLHPPEDRGPDHWPARQRERRIRWPGSQPDRKSTRLNSSHSSISYAVFCLKKKKSNTCDSTRSSTQTH